jgi:cytochrome bd-type quinol oxidase subunit 2
MNVSLVIYLASIVDSIIFTAGLITAIGGIVCCVFIALYLCSKLAGDSFFYSSTSEDERNSIIRLFRKIKNYSMAIVIVALLIAIFVPNSKSIGAMYILPKIINNEDVKKVSDNLLELAVQWTDKQLEVPTQQRDQNETNKN